MMKIRKFFVAIGLFFIILVSYASVGHLEVTLVQKKVDSFSQNNNQAAIAKALLGYSTKIPDDDKDVFTDVLQVSFAYGDDGQNSFAFVGQGKNNQSGVYLFQDGSIEKIANTKTEIPKGTAYFEQFIETNYDADSGQVVFIGTGAFGQKGVYFFDGKKVSKMVDQQDLNPLSNHKFVDFSDINLSDQALVFRGIDDQNLMGIYLYTADGIYKIMDVNDKIEGNSINDVHIIPDSFGYNQLTVHVDFNTAPAQNYLVTLKYVPY